MPRTRPVFAPIPESPAMVATVTAADVWAEGALGVPAAAEFVGVSTRTIWNEMDAGRIAFVKHGTKRLIAKRVLVAWLARKDHSGVKT
ncbi:MAG: helix-turn-helix domain-containing protein [Planctomycetes bacterium]|nr:helix-turn-helix domain-containing protein [Planctomycetota bacterium]